MDMSVSIPIIVTERWRPRSSAPLLAAVSMFVFDYQFELDSKCVEKGIEQWRDMGIQSIDCHLSASQSFDRRVNLRRNILASRFAEFKKATISSRETLRGGWVNSSGISKVVERNSSKQQY